MKARPGGRTAQTRTMVSVALEALLTEKDPVAITMVDVATRAGVAPSSLYRRWGDVRTLMMDVAMERLVREKSLPDKGTLHADLHEWAQTMAASLGSPGGSMFFRIAISAAPRSSAEAATRQHILGPRLEQIGAMLKRARVRGELVPTISEVTDYLLAPLYMRILSGAPVNASIAATLVDTLLAIASARATNGVHRGSNDVR